MDNFLNKIIEQAKKNNKRIAFDEIQDERILKAARRIKDEGIAVPVLVGKKEEIINNATNFNVNIDDIEIQDPTNCPDYDKYAEEFYNIRKHKGLTLDQAKETLQTPIYFATILLQVGVVDGLISGAVNTTANTLRPALQIIKTKKGINTASSYFLMMKDEEILLFADCGFNIDPNAEELSEIAISTNDSAKSMGLNPTIAMLSFSTKGSAKHPNAQKVIDATNLVKEKREDIVIDGELQFDAAYVKSVGEQKCPGSKVAGNANIFVFPNLDSGNICYKVTQRLGKYKAIGPIVQGLNKPVNDLSRGCSVEDIIDLCAITAME